jgi:ShK domain-like
MRKGCASFRICAIAVLLLQQADADAASSSSPIIPASTNNKRGECIETENDTYQCFSNTAAIICEDQEPRCPEWQQQNECLNNPEYMLPNCRKSCQSCIDGHAGISQVAPGNSAHRVLQRLVDTVWYMSTHGQTPVSCRNDREECTYMAVEGKCGSEWMNEHCKAACRKC